MFRNHSILSIGPPMPLIMGLTTNVGGLLEVRSFTLKILWVLISKYRTRYVGNSFYLIGFYWPNQKKKIFLKLCHGSLKVEHGD